jgi:outer membrane protein assembly factor BamB
MTTERKLVIATSAVLLLLASAAVIWILQSVRAPGVVIQERQPGMDRPAKTGGQVEEQMAFTRGKLVPGTGVATNIPGAWPRFRGPNGDNIATDPTPITRQWGTNGPAKLWSLDLGEGFAGAAVLNGRVYIIDYDQPQQADALRCLSLADGQEIWRFTYPVKIKRFHGMSRTIPAVTEKYTVSIGPKCHVVCVDTISGQFVWGLDLVKEFGVEVPQWYAGQCPLIDGDRVILATGGDSLMVAVELATGKVIWKAPNPRDWKMTHSSIVPLEFAGQRMYAYCGSGGVAGVAASDGKLLWDTDVWTISIATIPQPLPVGDGKIFLSGGYNSGSMMLQLKHVENKIVAEPLFRLKPTEFGATQHTPILHDGNIYGVRPDGQLTCLDLNGKVRWASGGGAKFGMGSFMMAQGLMFLLNDEGWLTLAEVNPASYRQLAKARVLLGHDSWAPMALVNGRLLARDMTQMVCLDVAGAKP